MALLNTAASRPSVILLILRHLARQRGKKDELNRLISTLAPPGLSKEGKHQNDLRESLQAAIDLCIVNRTGDEVRLSDQATGPAAGDQRAMVALLRAAVLSDSVNTGEWGSQLGARDLTNSLAWYLSFPASIAPTGMEGNNRSVADLSAADFGPRQPADGGGGWPIANDNRWQAFQFWARSLGFAWVAPNGNLVPDPTPVVRDAIPTVFDKDSDLEANTFVARLGEVLPVLDNGKYRQFVESNWRRPKPEQVRLSAPLSDALERLRSEQRIAFSDRDDAPRVTRADGTTFSHVQVLKP